MLYIVASFDLRQADLNKFELYEQSVLAILAEHGGQLLHRLRSETGFDEVHVLTFPSEKEHYSFLADPRRAEISHIFEDAKVPVTVGRFRELL